MKWKAYITKDKAKNFEHPVEDDLVSIDFNQLDEQIHSSIFYFSGQELQFRFAMVESMSKDFKSRTQYSRHRSNEQSHCEVILNLKVIGLRFALNDLLNGCKVELNVITSLKTVRRQWNGLINLHTSVLVRDILCPRGGAYFCCQANVVEQSKPPSLVSAFTFLYPASLFSCITIIGHVISKHILWPVLVIKRVSRHYFYIYFSYIFPHSLL